MDFKDYYATLGIAKTATDKEVKQAYRKLARKFHPDVNPGDRTAEARFKDINEAYEVLGDPEKRKKYDELGANWRLYEEARQQGQPWPFEGGGWTSAGGPGGFRTVSGDDLRDLFGEQNPFSDFFHAFFAGGPAGSSPKAGRGPRSRRGQDVEQELELSLEEAFAGATRRVSVKHAGHTRTVDVRIPAGIGDGARVRVSGEGGPGTGSGVAGDLYLRVRCRPHARFDRKGRDLYTSVAVPVTTAVLGGEAEVRTIDQRSLRLKVPAGTAAGQVFRLKGHGMPAVGNATDRGDLFVTVTLRVPRRLTAEQRRLYEALARLEGESTTSTE